MAQRPENQIYEVPSSPSPVAAAPQYQSLPPSQPMTGGPPGGSPPPMHSPHMYKQQAEQPGMYQQQPHGMSYQQQSPQGLPPDQQAMYPQQQMYGQPPPQEYQGGPQQMAGKMNNESSNFKTAVPIPNLGMGAAPVDCPSCGVRAMTKISYHSGNTTHLCAGITFCFTLCLCFIPYMVNACKDVDHKCGNCGQLLATWHKSGSTEAHVHP